MITTLLLTAAFSWMPPSGVTCQTYEEKTVQRQQTICSDGTRAVSTWRPSLQRWDTVVTPPPGTPRPKSWRKHR